MMLHCTISTKHMRLDANKKIAPPSDGSGNYFCFNLQAASHALSVLQLPAIPAEAIGTEFTHVCLLSIIYLDFACNIRSIMQMI